MASSKPHQPDPDAISGLLMSSEIAGGRGILDGLCDPAELADAWRLQLDAPMKEDLPTTGGLAARFLGTGGNSRNAPKTFGQLLNHSRHSRELLASTKDYAKANLAACRGSITDLWRVLYYAAIAAALCVGQRITSLKDADLRLGFAWATQRPWLDDQTLALLRRAATCLPEVQP